ncbi:hypothetical protein NEDG_00141 [Nematocida displodere]|uniref:Uncharacterized protein n=1 Tax=Nematocida displodere TaxID=1805483 RepID=A0A177EIX0_9MICR|nr:hypothetical protein NEDG_00141 [Nematocida displodere]
MIEEDPAMETVNSILHMLYNKNQETNYKGYLNYNVLIKTPEYKYFEEIIGHFFPYNLELFIPDILIPINMKYLQENTEELAMNILNRDIPICY